MTSVMAVCAGATLFAFLIVVAILMRDAKRRHAAGGCWQQLKEEEPSLRAEPSVPSRQDSNSRRKSVTFATQLVCDGKCSDSSRESRASCGDGRRLVASLAGSEALVRRAMQHAETAVKGTERMVQGANKAMCGAGKAVCAAGRKAIQDAAVGLSPRAKSPSDGNRKRGSDADVGRGGFACAADAVHAMPVGVQAVEASDGAVTPPKLQAQSPPASPYSRSPPSLRFAAAEVAEERSRQQREHQACPRRPTSGRSLVIAWPHGAAPSLAAPLGAPPAAGDWPSIACRRHMELMFG